MNRFRFSLESALIAVLACAVVSAIATRHVQKIQLVAADVEYLRKCRANVDVAVAESSFLAGFAPDFRGYPTDVRKYFDTPDLRDADEFIDIVGRNPTIRNLTVDGSPLSDSQVQRMLGLPLTGLMVSECPVGEVFDSQASTTLEFLSFHRTRLNDSSLMALGGLPKVRRLDLTRTRVSDASIDYLAALPALTDLIIRRCKISEDGKRKLESLMPNANIEWEPLR